MFIINHEKSVTFFVSKMHSCSFCVTSCIFLVALVKIVDPIPASIPAEKNDPIAIVDEEEKLAESQNRDERAAAYRKPDTPKGDHITCKAQGKIAMKGECYKYFICSRPGVAATVGKCPAKKVFHHQQRNCLKLPKTECEHSMCKNVKDKFPDPYSKMQYLTCKHMYPEVVECPKGEIYDIRKKKCLEGNMTAVTELKESDEKEEGGGGSNKKPPQQSWARAIEITNLDIEIEQEQSKEEKDDEDPHEKEHEGHNKFS